LAVIAAGVTVAFPLHQSLAANEDADRLAVVWTSGDAEVAHRMCLMYSNAAKEQGWFDEVRLVVWGPSQKLVAADKDIREKVLAMREAGVIVEACVACAKSYGLVGRLEEIGLPVKPMGEPLSDFLKADYKVITF
jgi:hypothetical protein